MFNLKKEKENVKLENIYKAIPIGILTVDLKQKITSWSIGAEKLSGLKAKDVLGKRCTEIWKCPACIEKCGLYAKDVKKPIFGKECSITLPNKKNFIVSKNVDYLLDDDETIIGGIESFVDVTQNKKDEKILKERTEELEKFNKLAIGRELRMIELKKKIKELEEKLQKK